MHIRKEQGEGYMRHNQWKPQLAALLAGCLAAAAPAAAAQVPGDGIAELAESGSPEQIDELQTLTDMFAAEEQTALPVLEDGNFAEGDADGSAADSSDPVLPTEILPEITETDPAATGEQPEMPEQPDTPAQIEVPSDSSAAEGNSDTESNSDASGSSDAESSFGEESSDSESSIETDSPDGDISSSDVPEETDQSTETDLTGETDADAETFVNYFASAHAAAAVPVYAQGSGSAGLLVTAPAGTVFSILSVGLSGDGEVSWYHVIFEIDEYSYEGFVRADSVITNSDVLMCALEDVDQTDQFPADYQALLRELKKAHPNWSFKPLYVNLNFEDAVVGEQKTVNNNLVGKNQPLGWKSMETKGVDADGVVYNYDWSNDSFYCWEPNFVAASDQAVRYCLDPRNFINDTYIFMFEELQYEAECQTVDAVNAVLKGTFMYDTEVPGETYTYAWLLHWIGEKYNINPVMLASRVRQEQGTEGTSPLISGTYPGYEGLYNYFNFSASGHTTELIVISGLNEARTGSTMILPDGTSYTGSWDTPAKALIGGALKLATSYIMQGQDSLYLQKFCVYNNKGYLYWHQYMQAIQSAMSESRTVRRTYSDMGLTESEFVFKIPVFNNMPEQPASEPGADKNPNNCLKSLKVNGSELITSFDKSQSAFSCTVSESSVSIEATAASSLASVSAPSSLALSEGDNTCQIVITAENGEARTYTLTVTKTAGSDAEDLGYGDLLVQDQQLTIGLGDGACGIVRLADVYLNYQDGMDYPYIDGIQAPATADSFLRGVQLEGNIRADLVKNATGEACDGSSAVGTGVHLIVTDLADGTLLADCPLIVYGDLSGDGQFNVADFSIAKAVLLGKISLNADQAYAGDLNQDGSFNVLDFSVMKAALLGRVEILQ